MAEEYIKKSDLVKIRVVDRIFYAVKPEVMGDKISITGKKIREEIPETKEAVDVELELQKAKDAELIEKMKLEKEKADKKAKLIAELEALEE